MKRRFLSVVLCLMLAACGNRDNSGRATTTAPLVPTAEPENDKAEVLHQMPGSDQIHDGYDAILEKAGTKDPELMEVGIYFSRSIAGPDHDGSHMSVKLGSPTNKNKILFYRYDFPEKQVREPSEVTLTTGLGSTEKFIDTYDGFKASLFSKAEILDFDKADEVYKDAIAKSEYGADKCYVSELQFMYFPNGLQGRVSVQSTRSSSASKSYIVDKSGQTTFY